VNRHENEKLETLLRTAIVPIDDSELKHDLWPQMLVRLEVGVARVPWFDWALAALVAGWILVDPQTILALLYHL
jgi:hypothetical protein